MRLFLIALAVAYAMMVGFAQTLNIGSRDVLSSAPLPPSYSASVQSVAAQGLATEGVAAHSVAATSGQAACGAAETGDRFQAGGCAEQEPRRP